MNSIKDELKIYSEICKNFDIVFDVGCRDDINYFNIKEDCEYHLFEPNTEALDSIKNKILELKNHNIILNEYGLSDEEKDNCIYYKNVQSFKEHWSVISIDTGERFSLKKLDDYVENNKINKIDFLKIDVEALDYKVILGGLKTIKNDNKVSFVQVEYSEGLRQYIELLDNFQFYLMMEPELLKVINKINKNKIIDVDFNKSLIKLDDRVIDFIDIELKGSGAGGNIFGVNKNIDFELFCDNKEIFFKII